MAEQPTIQDDLNTDYKPGIMTKLLDKIGDRGFAIMFGATTTINTYGTLVFAKLYLYNNDLPSALMMTIEAGGAALSAYMTRKTLRSYLKNRRDLKNKANDE